MSEMLNVSEAAARLGLNRSTVSRQVRKLGVERDRRGKFEFAAFAQARAETLEPARGGSSSGRLLGDPSAADLPSVLVADFGGVASPADPAFAAEVTASVEKAAGFAKAGTLEGSPAIASAMEGPPLPTTLDGDLTYRRAKTAREAYGAKLAKLDWEARSGLLIARAEVEEALAAASRQLRDKLFALAMTLAPELAAATDPGAVRTVLERELRRCLAELAGALKAEADAAA